MVSTRGMTLIELVLGALTLVVAIAAILGAYLGQLTLNEHARNISLAVHDANRVIEQMRQENTPCTVITAPQSKPEINPAFAPPNNWNAWVTANGPSLGTTPELVVVTCQDPDGGTAITDYCGTAGQAQVGADEWRTQAAATTFDPLRVTVSVCWRHRERVIGECAWNGAALSANDTDADGVIESPAMLTTLVTCRG